MSENTPTEVEAALAINESYDLYSTPKTFKEAKEMTIKKWKAIVRGKKPESVICGFCLYYAQKKAADYCTHLCPFTNACDTVWNEWDDNKTAANAQKVLDAVRATEDNGK
jgi:hypothetical protein